MPSFVKLLKTALVVAPLLASCGGSTNTSPAVIGPNGLVLPDCTEGQLLGADAAGAITCLPAVAGMLQPPVPACIPDSQGANPDGQALNVVVDGVSGLASLTCVNKGTGANDVTTTTRITMASTNITNLQNQLSMITNGGGNRAKFIGVTKQVGTAIPNGDIVYNATRGGKAGALLCDADLGVTGSHICSPFEIYESVIAGDILNQAYASALDYQVYMQAWVPGTGAGGFEPTTGQGGNCGAGTYQTGDRNWQNMIFRFEASASGIKIPKFNNNVTCNARYNLACCK